MHEEMLKNTFIKLLTSFSAVIGVLIGIYFKPGEYISFSLFGLVGGMFIYLVVHDSLSPKKERPLGYIAGVATFIAIITLI
jgi:zinc transporter ZupT